MIADQFRHWHDAITNGTRIETERGNPRSGYFKQVVGDGRVEVIAIARNEAGRLECFRTIFGDGSKLGESEIDDLFGKVCLYPITEDAFKAVYDRGETLPPEYGTRLTMKDQQAGVAWTPEYGRKRLGIMPEPVVEPDMPAENPRAVVGDNRPPPDDEPEGHVLPGAQTPDKLAFADVSKLTATVKRWLESIGGGPRDKAEADTLADNATKFATLGKKANTDREAEKRPHLDACREVDDRWRQPIANAESGKKRCKEIAQQWRDAENARRADEARKANERAAAEAQAAGGVRPEPIQAERVGGIGNVRTIAERTVTSCVVTDARAYLAHLLTLDGDLPAEIVEAAGKVAQRRGEEAPGVEKRTDRRAA